MEIYNKYRIEHVDGTPLKGKRYFVLRLDSDDPVEAARVEAAMRAYNGEVKTSASNAAAMREALETIDKNTDLLDIAKDIAPNLHPSHSFVAVQIRKIVRAALAATPRNCEVGTPSEQYQRFLKYCKKNTGGCDRADRYSNPCAYCFSQWAQMPYEEGATDGSK